MNSDWQRPKSKLIEDSKQDSNVIALAVVIGIVAGIGAFRWLEAAMTCPQTEVTNCREAESCGRTIPVQQSYRPLRQIERPVQQYERPVSYTSGRAMGNIAPYRRDMMSRIARNFNPPKNFRGSVIIVLGQDGTLISDEVLESSGNKQADRAFLTAVETTEYQPLPDWYRGETLQFKINLEKLASAREHAHSNIAAPVTIRE
jgi:TonB family protein